MSDAAGAVLAVAVRAVGVLRRSPRPLHPRGVVHRGVLLLDDAGAPGARELGAPAVVPALVRVSRSAGLPAPLPDVGGLAVRWWRDGREQDLLLSSTGLGRLGRFALVPRLRPSRGPFSTIMPFVDEDGRGVVLAAVPVPGAPRDGVDLLLLSARPGGAWRRCGRLTCPPAPDDGDDDALRIDPVRHAPMAVPGWAARVRRRSYRVARERGTAAPPPQRAASPAP
ncbi:hypothetical protein [Cellulomonas olei]|uniref:hypothetical protein n=1 Tax=Cellulomonas sp. P4 TaxID=3142533 RepID=UPI0031BA186F